MGQDAAVLAQTYLLAIDGLSTSSVVVGKVTTLEHELGNDTVEDGVLEAVDEQR